VLNSTLASSIRTSTYFPAAEILGWRLFAAMEQLLQRILLLHTDQMAVRNTTIFWWFSVVVTRSTQPHILMYMFCPYVISTSHRLLEESQMSTSKRFFLMHSSHNFSKPKINELRYHCCLSQLYFIRRQFYSSCPKWYSTISSPGVELTVCSL
jgi:hypothetical protein